MDQDQKEKENQAYIVWFKEMAGFSPDEFIRMSLRNGHLGQGRINGFDDKPDDVVHVTEDGTEITRREANYWLDYSRAAVYGWMSRAEREVK